MLECVSMGYLKRASREGFIAGGHVMQWSVGMLGDVGTAGRAVKCVDPSKTNGGESGRLVHFLWSRTKVWGSKMIRYRRSPNCKLWRPRFRKCPRWLSWDFERNQSSWPPGGVWSQGWNLKELTEAHHQEWNLRLNSTQHGESYRNRTWLGLTD